MGHSPWCDALAAIDAAPKTALHAETSTAVVRQGELHYRRVVGTPTELHAASGLAPSVYAAARCIASEVGTGRPAAYLLSVGEALRNAAREKSTDVYTLLTERTSSAYSWTRGWYGEQHGRFAATSRDPVRRTVEAARVAIDRGAGFTNGAARWLGLSVLDRGSQGDRKVRPAHEVVAKWGGEGWHWIGPLPKVDTYVHCLFKRGPRATDNRELQSVIEMARAGKPTVGTDSPHDPTRRVAETETPWWSLVAAALILVV